MTKTVEFYIHSAQGAKAVYPIATTDIDEQAEAYSRPTPWSCPFCRQLMQDLAAIRRPSPAWPEVMVLVCDQGEHRVEAS
jgi:hypothetical protein